MAIAVLLAAALALSGSACKVADAAVVAQLPFSQAITSLVIAPDGTAWVGIKNLQDGDTEIGHVTADGSFITSSVATPRRDQGAFGLTAAVGPDGRVWFGGADGWLYRADADHRVVHVGPFADADTDSAMALGSDGTLWDAANSSEILHVRSDGTYWTSTIPVPACTSSYSSYYFAMARATDGATWLADLGCARLFRITAEGATVVSLNRLALPDGLSAAPGGAMWFDASNDGLVGRVTSTGQVASFRALYSPNGGIASAPDGTAWYSSGLVCGLTQLNRDGGQRHAPGPLVPKKVAFGPDGTLWMASARRIVHTTVETFERFRGSCDRKAPIITSDGGLTLSLSVSSLRRGLSVHVNEPADVSLNAFFTVNGHVERDLPTVGGRVRVARDPRRSVHFSFPVRTLDRIHRYLSRGSRVTMDAFVEAADFEGNPGILRIRARSTGVAAARGRSQR